MTDFIKVTVHQGGEIYLSKYGISYFARRVGDDFTVIKFTGDRNEEYNCLKVVETPNEIIKKFEG